MTATITATRAQRLATDLRTIAEHLDSYPQLAPCNVMPGHCNGVDVRLQVMFTGDRNLANIIDWARSLDAHELAVQRCGMQPDQPNGFVHLHCCAEIAGGLRVDVWTSVHDLDDSDLADGDTVAVDDLVQVAAETAARLASDAVHAAAVVQP